MRFPYHGAGVAIIDSKNRVLLGCRSKKPFMNRWSVPGGEREVLLNETPIQTAFRETLEETGIDLTCVEKTGLGSWSLKVPFFSWTTFFFRIDSYPVENLKPCEFSVLKFVSFDEIKTLGLRPFSRFELGKLKKKIQNG